MQSPFDVRAICNLLEEAGSSGWEGSSLPNGEGICRLPNHPLS